MNLENIPGAARTAVGTVLVLYSVAYTAQYVFSALYESSGQVWNVFNYITAVLIVAALVANAAFARQQNAGELVPRVGNYCRLTANFVLVIWFFHNWIRLLILEAGQYPTVQAEVLWNLIAALVPVVLIATGSKLIRG